MISEKKNLNAADKAECIVLACEREDVVEKLDLVVAHLEFEFF